MIELLVFPLVKKLDDFIRQERIFLRDRKKGLLYLRNSLEQLILCSVGEHEDGVHFEDVVNHVHKVDDFIDDLILKFEKSRGATKVKFSRGRGKCLNIASDLLNNLKKHSFFQEIDEKVGPLKTNLDKFHNKKILLVQKSNFVAENRNFNFQTKIVIPMLSVDENDQIVIGVVDMGVSGKMIQDLIKAYKIDLLFHQGNYSGKHYFAWLQVSKYNEIHYLLREVIKAFNIHSNPRDGELDMMGTEELGLYLYESLMERPYVVVLEDVSNSEVWAHLRRVLPDNKLGSTILITTRIRSLIDESGRETTPVNELEAENVTLPQVCSIPTSSFDDLHHLLKLCYLYLGLFPENFEIKVDKLLRMWVAEGFIKLGQGGTLEEVAMDYVNELADRSLIEIVKRNATRIATFRIHPCLRALILSKSGELKLFHAFSDQNVSSITDPPTQKRFVSHHGFREDFPPRNNRACTLMVFNKETETVVREDFPPLNDRACTLMAFSKKNDTVVKVSAVVSCIMKLNLLQVLDLEGTWFPTSRETGNTPLPDPIGNLILLRYLGLNDTYIDDIPPFIKNLQALQTLYVDREILVSIPNEINELNKLRHLYGRLKWPFRVSNLFQLQTLGHIEISYRRLNFPDPVMLIELYLVFTSKGGRYDMGAIGEITTLKTLYIKANGSVDLKPLSKCRNLLQLKLKGEIGELPSDMHEIFPNLKYLSISYYNKETPFPIRNLAKLPKLTILDFYHLSLDDFNEGGSFPQLEILQLIKCTFKGFSFVEETMPLLKELLITDRDHQDISDRLKSLPEPQHWGLRDEDDDWPYFPRTMP